MGRRRSDRWVAFMLIFSLLVFVGSVVYTSARLDRMSETTCILQGR